MSAMQRVLEFLSKNYPKPHVDPEWLQGCYDWIVTEKNFNPATEMDKILEEVEQQLLSSDLRDSMLHGTGILAHIAHNDTAHSRLVGPVLVQVEAITDIGVSAYHINKTRQLREERFAAGEREEGERDDEVEEEGPIPEYTRSMLRFEIGDGSTTMRAMEYRKIPEFKLGQTPLGYKMLIHNVEVRRGIALLEPSHITLKGYQVPDLDASREFHFANSLRNRLGLPPQPDQGDDPPPDPNNTRSPLRDISPPPSPAVPVNPTSRLDDEDQPRRRRIPNSSTAQTIASSSSTPTNQTNRPPVVSDTECSSPKRGPINIESGEEDEYDDTWMSDTRNRPLKPLPTRTRLSSDSPSSGTPTQNGKGKEKQKELETKPSPTRVGDINDDDDDMFDDGHYGSDFLAEINEAEMNAMEDRFQNMGTPSRTTEPQLLSSRSAFPILSADPDPQSQRPITVSGNQYHETITIDDDEEDDKENIPTLTRNVRRRTSSRPIVPPEDVIDISD